MKLKDSLGKCKKYTRLYLSMFSRRNSNVMVFGSWFGVKFADNPKYLCLECHSYISIRY